MLDFINTYGNCASFAGLLLSVVTIIITGTVSNRVNSILREKKEENKIRDNRNKFTNDLNELLTHAKTERMDLLLARDSYEKLDAIIQCYLNYWTTINKLDNKMQRILKKRKLKWDWKKIKERYRKEFALKSDEDKKKNECSTEVTKFISFLTSLKNYVC